MSFADLGNVRLWFDVEGDVNGPALLLISGQGSQGTDWEDDFRSALIDAGFYVVRYDNRDAGESTHIDAGPVDLMAVFQGDFSTVAYTLDDLAADAIGLLDYLAITKAHVVGHSLGAMVAQVLATTFPQRVASLTCIAGTTGNRQVGGSRPEAVEALLSRSGSSPEDRIAAGVAASSVWASFALGVTKEDLVSRARRRVERDPKGGGGARQLAAVLAASDRTDSLRQVLVPALVVHGKDDPLVDVSGGQATAEAIAGARLLVIDQMAHDLPPAARRQIAQAVIDLVLTTQRLR